MFDSETKTWNNYSKRPERTISLGKWLMALFEENSSDVIQINADDGREISRLEIKELSIATAKFYRNLGLVTGDIVTLFCSHNSYLAPAIFGANLLGCIINTLSPRMDEGLSTNSLKL
jgi:hypothetical protein